MGAGILSIPIVMRYLGIFPGLLFITFIAAVTIYSVNLLILCQEITGKSGYSMYGKITLGAPGSLLVKIIIIISNFGMCCAYFRIFGETMQTTIQAFVSPNNYLVTNWHNYLFILLIGVIMLIFAFQKSISGLKSVSIAGVCSISVFIIAIIILFFYKAVYNLFTEKIKSNYLLPSCTAMEAFQSLPTVFLAFTFQFNVFPIYFSMKKRNRKEMMKATNLGVGFCLIIFFLTGLFGFMMYGRSMNDTILKELYKDMVTYKNTNTFIKYIIIVISIAFVFSTLMSFPPMFFSLKKNFLNSLVFCEKKCIPKHEAEVSTVHNPGSSTDNKNEHSPLKENNSGFKNSTQNVIILVLYASIVILTILIPKLKIIFHIVGSTAGNFISFIFPNLFYIRLVKMGKLKKNLFIPYFLLVIGICMLLISLAISIIKTD